MKRHSVFVAVVAAGLCLGLALAWAQERPSPREPLPPRTAPPPPEIQPLEIQPKKPERLQPAPKEPEVLRDVHTGISGTISISNHPVWGKATGTCANVMVKAYPMITGGTFSPVPAEKPSATAQAQGGKVASNATCTYNLPNPPTPPYHLVAAYTGTMSGGWPAGLSVQSAPVGWKNPVSTSGWPGNPLKLDLQLDLVKLH